MRIAGISEDARRLAEAHLWLVVAVAREHAGRGVDFDDLVGHGHEGLLAAAVRYDPGLGVEFASYAYRWIRGTIRRALVERWRPIRVPVHRAQAAARVARGEVRPEDLPDWRARLLAAARAARAARARAPAVALEAVADPAARAAIARVDDRIDLEALLARIDPRAARALRLRYGLGGGTPATPAEVGAALGIGTRQARRLLRQGLAALRRLASPVGTAGADPGGDRRQRDYQRRYAATPRGRLVARRLDARKALRRATTEAARTRAEARLARCEWELARLG